VRNKRGIIPRLRLPGSLAGHRMPAGVTGISQSRRRAASSNPCQN